ncbi:sigma 54-interacting transcriptional regulator [Enterococcus sp. AZ109]|uniref:sigma 54-interacting transcriptional regulator n=1 Tax=Enterococcus sp. AZ109 TaxID=2774634 RepID=UPI003F20E714
MEIVVFSGQKNLTYNTQQLINELNLEKFCKVVESTGDNTLTQASQHLEDGTKIFIARGRNFEMLRSTFSVPTINIQCTYEEILIAYNQAKRISNKIAIIGFGSIYETVCRFKRISREDFMAIEFTQVDEIPDLMRKAIDAGIDTFIGGISTVNAAQFFGVNQVLLEIDRTALKTALLEAVNLLKIENEKDKSFNLINTIISSSNNAIISFDELGNISYINKRAKKIVTPLTAKEIKEHVFVKDYESQVFEIGLKIDNEIIEINGTKIVLSINPLKTNHLISGAVVYLTETEKVLSAESEIRKQVFSKGHVARKSFKDIIGSSTVIRQTITRAKRYARSDNSVLISGESGTGKELFAQSIHNFSDRSNQPFIAINCAALSTSVLESELFGYVKGAFTGANDKGKMGIFEMAHNGTVFLDEIGEIPFEVQAKLLRVLQEKEIVRVGAEEVIPVDVRIISATNRNLKALSQENKFRGDLYYRLAVLELRLPSLAERAQDIAEIAKNYIAKEYPAMKISDDCLNYIQRFDYDGNIRHLINLLERSVVMSEGKEVRFNTVAEIWSDEFQTAESTGTSSAGVAPQRSETDYLKSILVKNMGNRKKTAQELGISTTTLWRKMKAYGLSD